MAVATAAVTTGNRRIAATCRLTLLVTALLISVAGADICFRKYSADRDACKGQIQGHVAIDGETCCASDGPVRGQGYATQLVKHPSKNGKKWFRCTACPSSQTTTTAAAIKPSVFDNSVMEMGKGHDKYVEEEVDSKLLSFQTNGIVQIDGDVLHTWQLAAGNRAAPSKAPSDVELPNDLLGGASRLRKSDMKTHRLSSGRRQRQKNANVKQTKSTREMSPPSDAAKNSTAEDGVSPVERTVWSLWSEWGPCSITCGDSGKQQRNRFCLTGNCRDGPDFEERPCADIQPCSVDGDWSQWSDWSTCNITCTSGETNGADEVAETGRQQRKRTCDNPTPKFGGADCIGPSEEFRPCDELPLCPVDGGWSDWTNWTVCSTTCGEGLQTRSRQCNNPVPRHGGRPCEGLELESAPCITRPDCPVNGAWSDWSRMETCSAKPCSGLRGYRIRFRSCTNPRPSMGGMPCRGRSWIREQCYNNDFCTDRVDGGWCLWSDWTACDDTVGYKTRERNCSCPPPVNGGTPCPGDSLDKRTCRTITPTPILPTAATVDRSSGCHGGDGSGGGSDLECDMEQEDPVYNEDIGSAME